MDDKRPSTPTEVFGFGLNITLLMAFDGLRSIVNRFGYDHTNDGACVYAVEKGGILTPVCIVGQFFHDLGILRALIGHTDVLTKDRWNGLLQSTATDNSGLMCNISNLGEGARQYLAETHGITFDDDAYVFLARAQMVQDRSEAWGHALEDASRWVTSKFAIPVKPATAVEMLNAYLDA